MGPELTGNVDIINPTEDSSANTRSPQRRLEHKDRLIAMLNSGETKRRNAGRTRTALCDTFGSHDARRASHENTRIIDFEAKESFHIGQRDANIVLTPHARDPSFRANQRVLRMMHPNTCAERATKSGTDRVVLVKAEFEDANKIPPWKETLEDFHKVAPNIDDRVSRNFIEEGIEISLNKDGVRNKAGSCKMIL